MFNNSKFNDIQFNWNKWFWLTPNQDEIVYNWFWMQNNYVVSSYVDIDNWPELDNITYNNPRSHWWGQLNYLFRKKIVTIKWILNWDNAQDLNERIDLFKKALWENEKTLDIKVNWDIRRTTASVVNFSSMFSREWFMITYIPFEVQFEVLNPFFEWLVRQVQLFTNRTSNLEEEAYNYGSAPVNPTVSLNFNTANTVNEIKFISWKNTITINETINTNDSVIIDCENKEVKINWFLVDYEWTFPQFKVSANSYSVEVNGTFDIDMNIYFYNNYL